MKVIFRDEAIEDLEEIARYIGERNRAAAEKVIRRIHSAIYETIANHPCSGRLEPKSGTREFPVKGLSYLVIYRPQKDFIDVIAVFHTSRDPKTKRR